ncbi:hypothetical protein [Streptomyces canus]|nr:hypothetical protein [Streptomyces canus]
MASMEFSRRPGFARGVARRADIVARRLQTSARLEPYVSAPSA